MEFNVQSNNFMLEFEYPLDWSFATDSLSDITEIASVEGALVTFPDSIGPVDSEAFGIPLPVDDFFGPCQNVTDENSLKDAISASIFPSDCYSVHDPNLQILEALPLNRALIAPDVMHTGKSAKSEPLFTQGLCSSETNVFFEEKVMNQAEECVIIERREMGRARLAHIGYNDIKPYFYMPITQAAKEMNVGLTILKKRCRELGIPRWPHRKMKSLRSLIRNVQELGKSPTVQDMTNQLETLGRLMEENPEVQLTEQTKKWRQACFKASYKKRLNLLTSQQLSF